MKEFLVIGISRINKYLLIFNKTFTYKINSIINEMTLTTVETKQLNIYLNIIKDDVYNESMFVNTSSRLQIILISLVINCLKTIGEKEKAELQEDYILILETISESGTDGQYLDCADFFKKLYSYNNILNITNENKNKKTDMTFEIINNDRVRIVFKDHKLNINDNSLVLHQNKFFYHII